MSGAPGPGPPGDGPGPAAAGPSEAAEDGKDLRPALARVLPEGWEGAIGARDQAALDEAVRRAWRVVYYRAAARTGDRRAAEEVAQEVFCRVLARMGSSTSDEALRRAYLTRAAHNLLHDQWRRRGRARTADAAYAGDRSGAPERPEDEVLRRMEAESLQGALRALPEIQARVLRLRIGEELSAEETGAVIGRSAAAVRQIQHRALATLRARLTAPGSDG